MPASIKQLANSKVLKDDVFAKWSDGLYYQAKVLECNQQKRQCLVVFEDDAKCWMNAQDLHAQLNSDIDEDNIVCCVCEDGLSKAPNQIIICDCCEQGYHMQCHKPTLTQEIDDEDSDWVCSTCTAMGKARKSEFVVNKQDDQLKGQKRVKMDTPAKKPTLVIKVSSDKKAGTPKKIKTPRKARTTKKAESSNKQPTEETLEPSVAEKVEEKAEEEAEEKAVEVCEEKVEEKTVELEPESKAISKNYKIPKIAKVGTTKNVRTKAQMKSMSSVIDYSISKEPLDDGSAVEEMHPVLIEAAMDVITNGFGTEEFVDIVAEDETTNSPSQNVLTEVRPNKRARKNNKTAAA